MMTVSETLSNSVHFESDNMPTESSLVVYNYGYYNVFVICLYSMCPLFINSLQVCCFGPGPNDDQTYTDEFNKVYCT